MAKWLLNSFRACLISLLISSSVFAGTTGKISGKIFDKATNEPLIGANIIIMRTTLGAAADLEGNYFIINIPPGKYDLKASAIGYTTVIIQNVVVSADQTTKIDFELSEQAVQLENVVVTATKPIVQKDLTSTVNSVSGEEISMLPVEDIQSVVNLQAGVVNGHFRGGRLGEVKYLINGVSANDVFSGMAAIQPEVNSIQEIQVITGTFNAEYGQALSGIVKAITKIPGKDYEGHLSVYTGDYLSSRDNLFGNINHISPQDIYNMQADLSGPIPGIGNVLKFFASGRYYYNDGYLYGKRVFMPSDSSNFSANNPDDWYVESTGDGDYVPMDYDRRYSLQGKLQLQVGNGRGIVFDALYSNSEFKDYNHLFKLNPNGDYTKFNQSFLGSVNYTHVFSPAAFADFTASALYSEYEQYVFEDPLDPGYVNPERLSDVSGNAFYTGGTQNWQFKHKTRTYTVKSDLTAQLNQVHQLKTGVEFIYHDIKYRDFQIVINAFTGFEPSLPEPGAFNYNSYHTNPYQFAGYIQDKIELDYLIVNLGVRFDYFEPSGEYLKNPDNIAVLDNLKPPFPDSLFAAASQKYQFSPRIGISYPMSDEGAIHISYGHFFQIPPFEFLYKNPNFRIPLTGNFPENIGNTIGNTNLQPQRTVMYEIGLQQQLTPVLGLTITAYQKDIRNLLAVEIHIKNDFKKFSELINRDYGSVKGITVSLEKRFSNGIAATLDYTYQVAKGNASDPNAAFNKAQATPPIEENKQLVPLDWDRRHSLNFTVTGGVPGDFIASAVGQLGSGLPYTPSIQNQKTGLENSSNRPPVFNVDLYLTKYFNLFSNQLSIFLKVYNLFDTANEITVFNDTGRSGYTLELTRAQAAPRGVNTLEQFFTRPDFYSAPRQIIIGAELGL